MREAAPDRGVNRELEGCDFSSYSRPVIHWFESNPPNQPTSHHRSPLHLQFLDFFKQQQWTTALHTTRRACHCQPRYPNQKKQQSRSSSSSRTSVPSIFFAFFSCVVWLYIAGRLWQDAENRMLLADLLMQNSAERPKLLTIEDKLVVFGCKDLERKIVEAELEITLAKSQGDLGCQKVILWKSLKKEELSYVL
ncbi:putative glycosyl transferase, family 31 [Helianthus anomalus]